MPKARHSPARQRIIRSGRLRKKIQFEDGYLLSTPKSIMKEFSQALSPMEKSVAVSYQAQTQAAIFETSITSPRVGSRLRESLRSEWVSTLTAPTSHVGNACKAGKGR